MQNKNKLSDRIFLWDNTKAFLIFLVVLGHAILPFRFKSDFIGGAYIWLNTFHMPLFMFITGLFSKRTVNEKKLNHTKIISYILIFYFMKITIHFSVLFTKGKATFNLLGESGTPWYIFVTAMYLIITHLLKDLNPRKVFAAVLIICLASGYWDKLGSTLMLSRMIGFYPFFYLGYLTDGTKLLAILRKPSIRLLSALFFIGFTLFAFAKGSAAYDILNPLYTNTKGYIPLPKHLLPYGPLLRLGVYLFSASVGLSFISILPSKRIPIISYTGQNTLAVYALHRQVLYFYQASAIPAILIAHNGAVIFAILFAASAVLTVILATKPFGYILYPFTHYTKWSKKLLAFFKK